MYGTDIDPGAAVLPRASAETHLGARGLQPHVLSACLPGYRLPSKVYTYGSSDWVRAISAKMAPLMAAYGLVLRGEPLQDTFVPSREVSPGHPSPLLAGRERKIGGCHPQGHEILLLHGGERPGKLALRTDFEYQDASELGRHHEGYRTLRRLLVPSGQ